MKKQYYTISEVAAIAGVTYQAIYKRLNSTLKDYVVTVDNRKCLRQEVLSVLELTKTSTVKTTKKSTSTPNTEPSSYEEELKRRIQKQEETINFLQEQIKSKDEQIKDSAEKIDNLLKLVENSQKIEYQYQLLLGDGKQSDIININDEEIENNAEAIEQEQEPKRKGLLNKLFKF